MLSMYGDYTKAFTGIFLMNLQGVCCIIPHVDPIFTPILQVRKLTLRKIRMLCTGSQAVLSYSSAAGHKQFKTQQLCY